MDFLEYSWKSITPYGRIVESAKTGRRIIVPKPENPQANMIKPAKNIVIKVEKTFANWENSVILWTKRFAVGTLKPNLKVILLKIITEKEATSRDEVRLIDENGVQMGVFSLLEAYQTAIDRKLDLAIVSETTTPKIAKIINYGKILYEQKKAKKNQKSAMKVKEIKFGLTVGEHD